MRTIQKIISAGFATCAIAAAAMPALSWTTLGAVEVEPVAAGDAPEAPNAILLALASFEPIRR